jgi:Ser/Thr protein kinase RdoA (MazF antagonist)
MNSLDEYFAADKLSSGGQGSVFKVQLPDSRTTAAVKLFHATAQRAAQREVNAVSRHLFALYACLDMAVCASLA